MSKLLLDEQPLLILPNLATKVGLNEAIVIQQIHYWHEINKKANNNYIDGHYWVYNTYEQWQKQFPFWCEKTIRSIMTKLENKGVVISGNYNKLKIDRTKWYRLNYEMIEKLENTPLGKVYRMDRKKLPDDAATFTGAIPESTTEITSKDYNNDKDKGHNSGEVVTCASLNNWDEVVQARKFFASCYKKVYGQEYHKHIPRQNKIINRALDDLFDEDWTEDAVKDMIVDYFNNVDCDHNLMHFCTEGILQNRKYAIY